jgi:CHAT domain-containing protein
MRGLLCAGAQSVLLSLWDLYDETAPEFMASFYRHLRRQREAAGALRAAMLECRENHPHPYYWAPFFLAGKAFREAG